MIRFFGAEDFIRNFTEHRMVYLAGRVGSGKSLLATFLTYMLLRNRLAEYCVSTMPIAWAIPADVCPSRGFCCVFDEAGVIFDNRSFANKEQNEFRKFVAGYLRKLDAFSIFSSRISPDVSFRVLTVQRLWDFEGILPLSVYQWSLEDGDLKQSGNFWVWDKGWLYRVDKKNPTPKFVSKYVPSSFKPVINLYVRAVRAAQVQDENYDPNGFTLEEEEGARLFFKLFGVAPPVSPDSGQSPWGRQGDSGAGPGDTGAVGVGSTELHIGHISEKADSGLTSFSL